MGAPASPAASRPGLTTRGVAAVTAAPVLLVAGALFGIVELYAVAMADLAVVAAAAAWVATRRWSVATTRVVRPARVAVGGEIHVELAVHNQGRHSSPALVLDDPFVGANRARGSTRLQVAPLPGGGTERGGYRLAAGARGSFAVGPLEVSLADPLGLARTTRTGAPQSSVRVHPAIERLAALPIGPGVGTGTAIGSVLNGGHEELFALRPYRPGDDLRRVHWRATARADELIVRQDQASGRAVVTIVLDLHGDGWAEGTLETGLTVAASVADAVGRAGLDTRLVTTAGDDTGRVGPGALDAVLDVLATCGPHPGPGLEGAGPSVAGSHGVVVVVRGQATPDEAPGGWPGAPTVTVVEVRAPSQPTSPQPAEAGVVRVAAGRPFAPAWEAALRRRGTLARG